ncbi:Transcriptional regulatory protein DegU [subsurface metagenome]
MERRNNVCTVITTTILLVNDQNVVRQGIRQLLEREADFEVVGEAGNNLEAVNLAHELKPDVIVTEVHMPKMGGVEAIRRIKTEHPQTAILILTMQDEEEYIAGLLRAGAAGCLLKNICSEHLVQAIRSVCAGEFVSNAELMQRLLKRATRPQPVALDYGEHLTRRETEVLELAARMGNLAVAAHLGITERTVKGHLTNIFQKLNVASRTEAVLTALRRGWISLEDK